MEFYQIIYREDQRKYLYPFSQVYFNSTLTLFFENDPIGKIVTASKADKIAVCSWRLAQKVRNIHPVTQEKLNGNYEVLSFTRNSHRHQMMGMANAWHPGFMPAIKMLWERLGFKMPGEVKHPIYQNHYSARADIYKEYVDSFLIPAMRLIEDDPELNKLMTAHSGYGKLNRKADLKNVQAHLGMSDYPMCPFVLERCPSLWMQMKRINVSYL